MADRLIKMPSELEVQPTIKMLVYGQPGVGKTTLGLSAPEPVLLDFDGGVHRVNPAHQVPTLQIKAYPNEPGRSYQDFKDLLDSGELAPFKTIVIDTAGKMLDYMGAWLIATNPNSKYGQKGGQLSQRGYGARKYEFIAILKQISIMGKHIVFVAHDKEERDGEQKIVRPDIGGSSGGDLIRELDLVGYMEMIGKDATISFNPCEKFYGKNTCGLPARMEVPALLGPDNKPVRANTMLTDIFAQYQDSLASRNEMSEQYDMLMGVISNTINGAEDAEGLNAAVKKIPELEVIWDSTIRARRLVSNRAKDLNLVFDKETKQYVSAG